MHYDFPNVFVPVIHPSETLIDASKEVGLGWDGMDWIDLAQDRDQCRALVNTVMNLGVP
jgi:hypothetical protein